MIRTVLVALDESPWAASATTLAIDWGKRFNAQLHGLGILDEPGIHVHEPVPLGASMYKKDRDEALLADADQRVKRALARFEERCRTAGVRAETVEDIGDPAECILKQAHRYDVVVIGNETHFRFETQDKADSTLARVLRASPRPIVTVPRDLPEGNGVVVAYGGGGEVARTLQTVLLLGIAGGETIHLVGLCGRDRKAEALAPLAAEFLESHGVRHELHIVESDHEPAKALMEQVSSMRPRLFVMGAHGHHPMRDLFFTSVTRAVLQTCPVPVLIGA